MTAVKDAMNSMREALKLADELKRLGESLKTISVDLKDHEKRLARLEAKWDAALELANIRPSHARKVIKGH